MSAERSKEHWAPLRLAQLGLLHNTPPFYSLLMPSCQKCLPCPLQDAQEEPMSRTTWEAKLQAFSEVRATARSAKTRHAAWPTQPSSGLALWARAASSKQEANAYCQELKHSRQVRCEKCVCKGLGIPSSQGVLWASQMDRDAPAHTSVQREDNTPCCGYLAWSPQVQVDFKPALHSLLPCSSPLTSATGLQDCKDQS